MSIFRRQNPTEDVLSTKKKEVRLDRQRIANAKAQAKVDEHKARTEAKRARTKVRENNGGASIEIKLAKPVGQKSRGAVKKR